MSLQQNLRKTIYGGDNMMNLSDIRYLPRWVILLIDVFFIFLAITISCYLIEKLSFKTTTVFYNNKVMYGIMMAVSILFMVAFRTYSGIIRHSTFIDLFKLFWQHFVPPYR